MIVVDCITTDLLCMRLCSELSQAESNPRHCKAEVGLSIWSRLFLVVSSHTIVLVCIGTRHN
jgi:hypothetical protein